jgi:hypothetical protein
LDLVHPRQLDVEHLSIQEEQRRQSLILSGRSDVPIDDQRREECFDLGAAEIAGVAAVVGANEPDDPPDIRHFGAPRHTKASAARPDLIE